MPISDPARRREYNREYWHRNKEYRQRRLAASVKYNRDARADMTAALAELKVAIGCVDCGYNEHPAALHFDHRDPATKLFNVSRMVGRHCYAAIQAEIMKCDIRCANCHALRTVTEEHHTRGRGDIAAAPDPQLSLF